MATVSKSITSKFEKINADLRRRSTVSESIPSIFKKDQPCTNRSRRAFKKRAIQSFSRLIWSFDILITKKWPIRSKNQWSNSQTDQKIIRGRHRCLEEQFPFALLERANSQIFCCAKVDVTQEAQVHTYEIFWNIGHAILLSGTLPKKFSLTAAQYSQRRCVVVPGSVSRLHGQPVWISARGLPTVCEGRQIAVLILYK